MTNYLTPAQIASTSHMLTIQEGETFGDFWVREKAFHETQTNWVVFKSVGQQAEQWIELTDSQAKHALAVMNKWASQSYVQSASVRLERISK